VCLGAASRRCRCPLVTMSRCRSARSRCSRSRFTVAQARLAARGQRWRIKGDIVALSGQLKPRRPAQLEIEPTRRKCGSSHIAGRLAGETGSSALPGQVVSPSRSLGLLLNVENGVMASESGGRADKLGNEFERLWAVRHLIEILAGKAAAVGI